MTLVQHVVTIKSTYWVIPWELASYDNPNLFTAMILMSPLVNADAVSRLNLLAAKLMGTITPNAPVGKLCPESVSRDMDKVYKYQYDPLINHEKIKAGFASQVLKATNKVNTPPTLILQGTNNKISDVLGAYYFMQHANCNREIKIYEGAKHHLHKETDEVKKSVMKEIETWIFNRVK
ncbi:putative monoglyceride lipase [Vaccinia virus]|uniref:Putative monoglyceride lipase n=1 Tax=Vaccinia virus TaxID=10245 RepID=A0A0R5TYX7_VACCV|nr:putative monoglyceride lipase [Vaccinia virus]